ncbi:Alpha-D-kanosaminyltransferase [Maioricimonas rarisocia]|uniref:Alpha-D-kanosaminyltransferase n=1 Tax=Maioricimonas rarisocia TaxID=2528026 RepID=A0A517Z5U1_9PLAN|nr:glycosyltransferase [Maioricimonas rarisocia]QDU37862.1 Alpha-D-kanosaminyltransferase [Maioricimonas rarisocia]
MTQPVPIGFCITELDPGGAERALVHLVRRLDRNRWLPIVYCLSRRGPLADDIESAGISLRCLDAGSSLDFRVVGRLRARLREDRPQILQTFLFHANVAGRLAAKRAGVPIVVSGIRVAEQEKGWHLLLERMTRRLVTHHVCVSRRVAGHAIRRMRLDPDRVTVIPNGVDFERFQSASPTDLSCFGIPDDARVLVSVGRLHPQKGYDLLIEAIEPLLAKESPWHLLIVGEGPTRPDLERQVRDAGLEERIHLPGYRDDVPAILAAADAFVLASRWEGMPNAVLEAMAAGLPVLATDVEGIDELLPDGGTGIVCKPKSVHELRRGLERLLTSGDTRTAIGDNAQTVVREQFAIDSVVQRYDELYVRLLSDAGIR